MKKWILFLFILIPALVFAGGKKDKVYEYLTSIEGMHVEIMTSQPYEYNYLFKLQTYRELGSKVFSDYDIYFKDIVADERTVSIIDSLNNFIDEEKFIIWNDNLYTCLDSELRRYSLDSGNIEKAFILNTIFPYHENFFFSKRNGLFIYYIEDTREIVIINLDSMEETVRIYTGDEFERTRLGTWSDFSENQVLIETLEHEICLYNFYTGEKKVLIDLNPIYPPPGKRDFLCSSGNWHRLNEEQIQFTFFYHGTWYLCEYTIPEEYR